MAIDVNGCMGGQIFDGDIFLTKTFCIVERFGVSSNNINIL